MRKLTDTKKFSPNIRLLWYAAALSGLLLFCFSPLTPPVNADTSSDTDTPAAITEAVLYDDTEAVILSEDEEDAAPVFLMQGDCGADVYRIQQQLESLGFAVGACSGVYTQQTASAVRRFQLDSGFVGDGVCSAAVSYAIACLSGTDMYGVELSEEAVCTALREQGYWSVVSREQTEEMSDDIRLRNALILFQRTHGLFGSGTADYATLCALGLIRGMEVRTDAAEDGISADAAMFDLRCRLLSEALAEYVLGCPAAYDLYTLTACAAVLCNRCADPRFPGSFDAVCSAGLMSAEDRNDVPVPYVQDSSAIIRKSRDLLLLRAAEDALRAHLSSDTSDFARGALYVLPANRTLPQDAAVCIRTNGFVFFR